MELTVKITKHKVRKMEDGVHGCIGLVSWEQKQNYSQGPELGVEETLHVRAHYALHTSQARKTPAETGRPDVPGRAHPTPGCSSTQGCRC